MIYISGEREDEKKCIQIRDAGYDRCVLLGDYIIEHKATVRQAAQQFGISKSTVHKDVRSTLRSVNHSLWLEVVEILERNKSERHLRGGEATRKKYKAERQRRSEMARKC
jgi:putative DeoR family transcriptional regulator (stage III sporulation protein D)